jgi:general secretion pathway protein D
MQAAFQLQRHPGGVVAVLVVSLALVGLARCGEKAAPIVLQPLPEVSANAVAAPRVSGKVGTPEATPPAQVSLALPGRVRPPSAGSSAAPNGDISLDFADTDIREVVAQILGNILQVNYTIDPSVHGSVTLRTVKPLARAEVLPTLQTILAQNGAALIEAGGVYRVLPVKDAATAPGLAGTGTAAGVAVVPLRYASAEDLAKLLQPYVASGGRVSAEPGHNALLVTGDPATRNTLVDLVRTFDIDLLAGQSYMLLPVTTGDAKDFATSLQDALRAHTNGPMAGLVRVVPMQRINAVLVVASHPGMIEDVRRVYAMLERKQRETLRSWHVYYLQNSRANDLAYVLQQAFTPNNVTAQPSGGANPPGYGAQQAGLSNVGLGGTAGGGLLSGGAAGVPGTAAAPGGLGAPGMTMPTRAGGAPGAGAPANPPPGVIAAPGNPLLGGLEPGAGPAETGAIRIIPDAQNNSLLIYATQQEEGTIEAMLRKIDIIPLQVRIDATIAEVDLNDQLQYGTQFFFKQGGLNGTLAAAFPAGAPGFVLTGGNAQQLALALLQSVTKVRVLSSPQLLVLDNQPAQLQVGDLVPYLTATSESTLVSGAPVINSINYMQTGVIMQVTPRVNSGGSVMLDIMQIVSDVDPSVSTAGIKSPAFLERTVQSRIVVRDAQTIGLAGLIRDTVSRQNQGWPWVKDIPLLGALLGQQNNSRTRTELLVLITPHVIEDQHSARALTEDLREQLINAAAVPQELKRLKPTGSPDPNSPLRHRLGLQ